MSKPPDEPFKYTIEYVPQAFAIVYAFGITIPLVFNFILRTMGCTMQYTKAIHIYGYSQTINIIMVILCAWPNSVAQLFFILYGAVHSSLFIFLSVSSVIKNKGHNVKYGVLLTMAGCQFLLVMTYKFYFFGNLYPDADDNTNN